MTSRPRPFAPRTPASTLLSSYTPPAKKEMGSCFTHQMAPLAHTVVGS